MTTTTPAVCLASPASQLRGSITDATVGEPELLAQLGEASSGRATPDRRLRRAQTSDYKLPTGHEKRRGKAQGAVLPSTVGQRDGFNESNELSYEDWVDLNPGNRVRIERPGERAASGSVDDVAEDASCFWVWLDDGRGRVLIFEGDGSTVWASA